MSLIYRFCPVVYSVLLNGHPTPELGSGCLMKPNLKTKGPLSTSAANSRTEPPKPAKTPRKSGGGSELKTRQETAAALGYSVRTLDRLTAAKVIPHIRTGRLVRYRLESVLAALQRNCEIKERSAA
jgi:excisionase family DNA binding protein